MDSYIRPVTVFERLRRSFAYYETGMGYSRRKEAREIAEVIQEAYERIVGITLGQLCAGGVVQLNVSCHRCQRRGRYKVARLIDTHGPGMLLSGLGRFFRLIA